MEAGCFLEKLGGFKLDRFFHLTYQQNSGTAHKGLKCGDKMSSEIGKYVKCVCGRLPRPLAELFDDNGKEWKRKENFKKWERKTRDRGEGDGAGATCG